MWVSVRSMGTAERQRWRWEVHHSDNGNDFTLIAHGTWCDYKSDAESEGLAVMRTLRLLESPQTVAHDAKGGTEEPT